jgi:hypothetical protein
MNGARADVTDRDVDVLESIYRASTPPHQRDLARALGLSLGMTNSILKRMARKGWLMIRKVNNRNIQYVVSSQGIETIMRRSYRYVRRTVGNIVRYKEAIVSIIQDAARSGYQAVVLIGSSDLDFIIEHACSTAGLPLCRAAKDHAPQNDRSFVIHAERPTDRSLPRGGVIVLWDVLADRTPHATNKRAAPPMGRVRVQEGSKSLPSGTRREK